MADQVSNAQIDLNSKTKKRRKIIVRSVVAALCIGIMGGGIAGLCISARHPYSTMNSTLTVPSEYQHTIAGLYHPETGQNLVPPLKINTKIANRNGSSLPTKKDGYTNDNDQDFDTPLPPDYKCTLTLTWSFTVIPDNPYLLSSIYMNNTTGSWGFSNWPTNHPAGSAAWSFQVIIYATTSLRNDNNESILLTDQVASSTLTINVQPPQPIMSFTHGEY